MGKIRENIIGRFLSFHDANAEEKLFSKGRLPVEIYCLESKEMSFRLCFRYLMKFSPFYDFVIEVEEMVLTDISLKFELRL